MSDKCKKRVCVIGCGSAGMSVLFQLGKMADSEIPEIVCYEKQDTVGGLWNYTWRTGTDKYGEFNHCCMYNDLWINGPKEVFEYPDYTYEKHFGKLLPSFAPRAAVRDYIEGRFTKGSIRDLKQFIQLATVVRRVEYNKDADRFTVIAENLTDKIETVETFTHVIVSTGVYGPPFVPDIPGIDQFQGRVLHSKDVKHINDFKDKRVLLIGASLSGQDLAELAVKFGASKICLSYKYRPTGVKWSAAIEERPLVEKFQRNEALFTDRSRFEADVVVFCTGYQLGLQFLSEELRVRSRMLFYPEGLYKGIVSVNGGNNKLMFVGLQYNLYSFNLYEVQAVWACRNMMGTILLPPKKEMLQEVAEMAEKVKDATKDHDFQKVCEFMARYFEDMVQTVGYEKDVLEAVKILDRFVEHHMESVFTTRDLQFRCIYTGKLAPAPKIPFMFNFDDSLKAYVDQ